MQQNSVNPCTSLNVAIIGQSAFAADVFQRLRQHGHNIVGVFTVLDKGNREDALGKEEALKFRFFCTLSKIKKKWKAFTIPTLNSV